MFTLRRLVLLFIGGLIILILAFFHFKNFAKANITSPWISSALNLQKQADLSSIPRSINGNIDCFSEPNGVCAFMTQYGTANTTGSVDLDNGLGYKPVVSYIDGRQHFIAIPNSSAFISYTTEPANGFYLYFNYNFSSSIKYINDAFGSRYQIKDPPDGELADRSGHKLVGDYTSMSFSENGKWMVVSEPNVAMFRVNLESFEVLPFDIGINYEIGLSPSPQTAISNDGRYAVVASKDFSRFRIFDLSTCEDVPSTISGPVNCQSRDLYGFMQTQVNGFSGIANLRFIRDDVLGIYTSYSQGSSSKIAKYILSTGLGAIHQQDYLALGDSYISGEGAFQYLENTDTIDNQCHVSMLSYPLLIGHELGFNSYHSVTCSGATTNDVINTSDGYRGQARPFTERYKLSLQEVSSILSNFFQGYIGQLDFVKQYQPKNITISIGGNDIGFSARLRSCLNFGTCFSTYEDRLEFVQEVNSAFPKLVDTYTKLKNNGAADANIYVIGYPQIAKAGGDCAQNVHMNNDELVFAQYAIDYLDTAIKLATEKAGVFYVDTQDSFYNHRLCEAGPGSVAMNGITAGNDFPDKLGGPIGRESYHPNTFGHQLLENRILSSTHKLTASMPSANSNVSLPSQSALEILNAPHENRDINITRYNNNLSSDLVYRGTSFGINVEGSSYSLSANSSMQIELHSTLISIGTITTDSSGNISGQTTIPSSVPAGFHTLHLYGKDVAGQPIDIYKVIYVAASEDDLDGNGISDNTQKCVEVVPSDVDYDKDGIDDSCDSEIDRLASTTQSSDSNTQLAVSFGSVSTSDTPASSSPGGSIAQTNTSAENHSQVLSANITKKPTSTSTRVKNFAINSSGFKKKWPEIAAVSVFLAVILSLFWKILPD